MKKRLLENLDAQSLEILNQIKFLAEASRAKVYLVGGPVRDLFLKRSTKDLDICVEGNAIALARNFAKESKVDISTYPAFGTATVKLKDRHVDFASSRTESYVRPGAFPKVEFASLENDLFRRDFTINAMAIGLNSKTWGKLIDPFGGVEDLKAGRVRVLHVLSFIDDPTRIVRAARFKCRFGFVLEHKTLQLLKNAVKQGAIDTIKIQRYLKEYNKIIKEDHSQKTIRLLKSWGAIKP